MEYCSKPPKFSFLIVGLGLWEPLSPTVHLSKGVLLWDTCSCFVQLFSRLHFTSSPFVVWTGLDPALLLPCPCLVDWARKPPALGSVAPGTLLLHFLTFSMGVYKFFLQFAIVRSVLVWGSPLLWSSPHPVVCCHAGVSRFLPSPCLC